MKPIRCILGLHTGQANGGTLMFHCPRCDDDYFHSRKSRERLRAVEEDADRLIAEGRHDAAKALAADAIRREFGPPRDPEASS